MFTYSKTYDGNKLMTLSTEFPLYSENMQNYKLDGYPYFLDYDRWHVSLITGTLVNVKETKTIVYPVLCAPLAMDASEYYDTGEIDTINDESMTIMVKINDEGIITALMMQDRIYFGTGFVSDPDWKPIIQYFSMSGNRELIEFIPLALFKTNDGSKMFLYFQRDLGGELYIKYCKMDDAEECDFEIVMNWNDFSEAFTYITDIDMTTFNAGQIQRSQFLESSTYGLLAYVSR